MKPRELNEAYWLGRFDLVTFGFDVRKLLCNALNKIDDVFARSCIASKGFGLCAFDF